LEEAFSLAWIAPVCCSFDMVEADGSLWPLAGLVTDVVITAAAAAEEEEKKDSLLVDIIFH